MTNKFSIFGSVGKFSGENTAAAAVRKLRKGTAGCFLILMFLFVSLIPAIKAEAAERPSKVESLTITRESKNSVKLTWVGVVGAKGYQISLKEGKNGKFKSVKSTSKTEYTLKKLKLGETYYIKVRAFVKNSKSTVYGDYSDITKYKMTEWVYLSDVLTPYAGGAYTIYDEVHTFKMSGNDYSNGFTMDVDYSDVHDLYFNLNGKYSSLTFEWGCVDGREDNDTSTVQIYEDDTLVHTLKRSKNDLTQKFTLDVSDVYKLRFVRSDGLSVGFGNVKLYY